jgi:hypothetical protein
VAVTADSAPVCDAAGCSNPATGSYLHAASTGALEFSLCDAHFARMKAGTTPVIVTEGFDLMSLGGRQVLIFD